MTCRPFFFDREALLKLAETEKRGYQMADPFPHAVLNDFLPENILEEVLAEFPTPNEIAWKTFNQAAQNKKLSCEDETKMGFATRNLLNQFNAAAFLKFLEDLTGIDGLIPDPHLRGGGWHQTCRGGSLGVHADFNYYSKLKLYRRVNAIIYLNKNWLESYGGHLEFWDKDMSVCRQKISPKFNRLAVFSTDDSSYHGHPNPLDCPEDETRKSLALYYYTVGPSPGQNKVAHSTIFRARPGQDQNFRG